MPREPGVVAAGAGRASPRPVGESACGLGCHVIRRSLKCHLVAACGRRVCAWVWEERATRAGVPVTVWWLWGPEACFPPLSFQLPLPQCVGQPGISIEGERVLLHPKFFGGDPSAATGRWVLLRPCDGVAGLI